MKSVTFIVPTNLNNPLLESTFLTSPIFKEENIHEILIQKECSSAGVAYNQGVDQAKNDILVCVHSDVFLPEGWDTRLFQIIEDLEKVDPSWGIIGCAGVTKDGLFGGFVYCHASRTIIGKQEDIKEVSFLDGVLLVFRKSSGLRFDTNIPGFNFYDVDMCLESTSKGLRNYAMSNFIVHNAGMFTEEPIGFWNGIQYVIQKRKEMLPIFTTYLTIYPDKLIMKRNYKGYKRIWLSKRQAKRRKRIQNLPEFWEKLKLQVGK